MKPFVFYLRLVLLIIILPVGQTVIFSQSSKTAVLSEPEQNERPTISDRLKMNAYYSIANIYSKNKQYDQAETYLKKALSLAKSNDNKTGIARGYYLFGEMEYQKYDLEKAICMFDSSLYIWKFLNRKKWQAKILNEKGVIYNESMAEFVLAKEAHHKSLDLYTSVNNKKGISTSCDYLGAVYIKLGEYDSAFYFLRKSIAINLETGNREGLSGNYGNMAIAFIHKSNYRKALEYFFKSLDIHKQLGEPYEVAKTNGNIGIVYSYMDQNEKSVEYKLESLRIFDSLGMKRDVGIVLNNIGTSYMEMGKYDKALQYLFRSIPIREELNDRKGLAYCYYNLGKTYLLKGKYDSALYYHSASFNIREEIHDKRNMAWSACALGQTWYKQGNPEKALYYAKKAEQLNKTLNLDLIEVNNSELLSNINADIHNYQLAFRYHVRFKNMYDSVINTEKTRKITQLEMKYRFDKQQQQIKHDREQEKLIYNAEIRHQKYIRNSFVAGFIVLLLIGLIIYRNYLQKKKADAEKELLLKEIHHRVKNNLQMISSLLDLQTRYQKDKKIKAAVMEGQSRVKSMALIHQLLYQDESLTKVNMREYTGQLLGFLEETFRLPEKSIEIEQVVDDIELDIETSVPVGLIISELVSNAFKYAFQQHNTGKIRVKLERKPGNLLLLSISDNGKGIPGNINPGDTGTLGFRLVHLFAEQINGKLDFQTGNGLQVTLSFNNPKGLIHN